MRRNFSYFPQRPARSKKTASTPNGLVSAMTRFFKSSMKTAAAGWRA